MNLKFYLFCPECRYVFKAELCTEHERGGIDKPVLESEGDGEFRVLCERYIASHLTPKYVSPEIISGLTGDRSDGDY